MHRIQCIYRTPKYIEQTLAEIKGEFYNIIIGRGFNTPLPPVYRSSIKKIYKATVILNDTIDQLILIDMYNTFHSKSRRISMDHSPVEITPCVTKQASVILEARHYIKHFFFFF